MRRIGEHRPCGVRTQTEGGVRRAALDVLRNTDQTSALHQQLKPKGSLR
jgi:hypothetical protein